MSVEPAACQESLFVDKKEKMGGACFVRQVQLTIFTKYQLKH